MGESRPVLYRPFRIPVFRARGGVKQMRRRPRSLLVSLALTLKRPFAGVGGGLIDGGASARYRARSLLLPESDSFVC